MAPVSRPNGVTALSRSSTERIQIVDEEKRFTFVSIRFTLFFVFFINPQLPCRPDLTTQIAKWGLRDVGFAYNIVAVFGSQSTGKSGLLVFLHMLCLLQAMPRLIFETHSNLKVLC